MSHACLDMPRQSVIVMLTYAGPGEDEGIAQSGGERLPEGGLEDYTVGDKEL